MPMDALRFGGEIRYWKPERAGGLAVVDVPVDHVGALGGLRQSHVRGTIGTAAFESSVMPAGGGRLALSVSKAMMAAAGLSVGDVAEIEITGIGRG
jgi:Domain of unknown function (DUF1905)